MECAVKFSHKTWCIHNSEEEMWCLANSNIFVYLFLPLCIIFNLIIIIITLRLDYNVMKTLIIFTLEKISRYTLIHSIAVGAGIGNHGIEHEDLDIWLIKIMFV